MSEQRVLPAKVYDALQLSAAMYGGIGAVDWFSGEAGWKGEPSTKAPYCYVGHLFCAGFDEAREPGRPLEATTHAFGIHFTDNDAAVETINARNGKGARCFARVTFEEWCAELNVVRGADDPSTQDELRSPKGDASEALVPGAIDDMGDAA